MAVEFLKQSPGGLEDSNPILVCKATAVVLQELKQSSSAGQICTKGQRFHQLILKFL